MTRPPGSALLAGATGLVGSRLLELLVRTGDYRRIDVLTRRALPSVPGGEESVHQHLIDFADLDLHAGLFGEGHVFCTLGTTIRKAGSREAFRRVDHDYPLELAELAAASGARHFSLVSSLGASPRARAFYLRVKGELEVGIGTLDLGSVGIVRPSLLLGPRNERRPGEEIAKRLSFLLPRKYAGVDASLVAGAMLAMAREERPGVRILENREIPGVAQAVLDDD